LGRTYFLGSLFLGVAAAILAVFPNEMLSLVYESHDLESEQILRYASWGWALSGLAAVSGMALTTLRVFHIHWKIQALSLAVGLSVTFALCASGNFYALGSMYIACG